VLLFCLVKKSVKICTKMQHLFFEASFHSCHGGTLPYLAKDHPWVPSVCLMRYVIAEALEARLRSRAGMRALWHDGHNVFRTESWLTLVLNRTRDFTKDRTEAWCSARVRLSR
jgi:hypothetical protein